VTHETRSNPRTPGRNRGFVRSLLVGVLVLCGAGAAAAQQTWFDIGALEASDPTYQRPYLFNNECFLSSIGSDVHFDVHELVLLDTDAPPTHLTANLCASGTTFDTVFYFYQRVDGSAGAFSPTSPCDNLVRYDDDYCDVQSAITSNNLVPGHLTMVVASYNNGVEGSYVLSASSNDATLDFFIFYDGFEPDLRRWSQVVQ